jgi:hypothetical protein
VKTMKKPGMILATLAGLIILLAGCQKTTPNPNDTTPPQIEIKIQMPDNQYQPATDVDYLGEPINVMAIVTDPDGVKSIKLYYTNTTSSTCTTLDGAVCEGSFPISVPGPIEQTLQGDSGGQVITKLPLLVTINGQFDCNCNVVEDGAGKPIGHVLKLRCEGQNWSSNPQYSTAQKDLNITIKAY